MIKCKLFSKNIFTLIFAFFFAFSIWNYIFSVAIEKEPPQVYDECLGVHLQPKKEYVHSREGFSKITTDNFGYNNDNHAENYVSENIDNIIFLGDSYTEALYVDRKENYVSVTEKLLNRNNYKFRSVNLGASGNAVPDYINHATCIKEKFVPKFVVIQLHFNDMIDEAIFPEHGNRVVKKENEYIIEHSPQEPRTQAHLIASLTGWFQPITFRLIENASASYKKFSINKNKASKKQEILGRDNFSELQEIVDWQMKKLKDAYGENLLLVYFPPTPYRYKDIILIDDLPDAAEKRDLLFEVAKNNNISMFNIQDTLVKYYKDTHQLAHGFPSTQPGLGHLNEKGNYLVAKTIYNHLNKHLVDNL